MHRRGAIQNDRVRSAAIQGEPGSNSHMAARLALGDAATIVPCAVSADVFAALAARRADCAVLPIENSLHGSVAEHYDLLLEHPVRIVGETSLHIRHHVIAAPGVELRDVRRVLSHPVALSQCRRWLAAHPQARATPWYDTAGSVKDVVAGAMPDAAALAPALAAELYGGTILQSGVEDHADNYTRFLTLVPAASPAEPPADADKLSLALSLEHRPGALVEALAVLSRAGLDLTRIESRPVPGKPWEYVFYIDLRYPSAARVDAAVAELRTVSGSVRELGRYVAAALPS